MALGKVVVGSRSEKKAPEVCLDFVRTASRMLVWLACFVGLARHAGASVVVG